MDVELPSGVDHRPPAVRDRAQSVKQRRTLTIVIVDQLIDRDPHPILWSIVGQICTRYR